MHSGGCGCGLLKLKKLKVVSCKTQKQAENGPDDASTCVKSVLTAVVACSSGDAFPCYPTMVAVAGSGCYFQWCL